jgi:ubiquinone/menaquinone biosynthesis C-methylase UbiE
MTKESDTFYQSVSEYYDQNAEMGFEERAKTNQMLAKMREDFRQITRKYSATNALEIGCGPGFDVEWFASEYPDRKIVGVDVSDRMISMAESRLKASRLKNAKVLKVSENDLLNHFKPNQFDMILVYFGALNTVADFKKSVANIHTLLSPGGHAILTFVNKWYFREMFVQFVKLNFKTAFARLKEDWGGYSPDRYLPSKCYSPGYIKSVFQDFTILEKKGYSIFSPAWYNCHKIAGKPGKAEKLWKMDESIQNTPLWSLGEYTLFVFKKD